MEDRELLELAAKGAGYDVQRVIDGRMVINASFWNPLTNDGDAMRLAIACAVKYGIQFADLVAKNVSWIENSEPDPYEATRRAVVQSAAEIGKTMP